MNEMINLFVDKIYQLDGNLKYEKEIYVYGITQGIMIFFNILFTLVVGIVMKCKSGIYKTYQKIDLYTGFLGFDSSN